LPLFDYTDSGGYAYPNPQLLTTAGYITDVRLWFYNIQSTTTATIASLNLTSATGTILSTATATLSVLTETPIDFIFNNPIYFDTSTSFNFTLTGDDGYGYLGYVYVNRIGSGVSDPNWHYPKIIIYDSTNANLYFNFPQNNATTTDFTGWEITYNTPESSTIAVSYGLVSSTLQFTDVDTALAIGFSATQNIPKSQPLIYPPLNNGVRCMRGQKF
jgi:hypothetical protein